jgi:hypothetical protein
LGPHTFGDLGLKHHAITAIPAGQIRQRGGVRRVSEADTRYVFMAVPFSFVVFLVVHPNTYDPAGRR